MFSIFSPEGVFNISVNWLAGFLVIFIIPSQFWVVKNYLNMCYKKIMMALNVEFVAIFGSLAFPGSGFVSISLFVYIVLNNFCGLFPYIFTSSSHGTFSLALALPLWVGHMLWAAVYNSEATLAHFVPLSTPVLLMPLMVMIEFISSMIRPFTLAIRLAANMIAGHLLLGLLSEKMVGESVGVIFMIMVGLIMLGVLEVAVSIIQGYVFSLLSTLYLNEVSSSKFIC